MQTTGQVGNHQTSLEYHIQKQSTNSFLYIIFIYHGALIFSYSGHHLTFILNISESSYIHVQNFESTLIAKGKQEIRYHMRLRQLHSSQGI